MQVALLGGSFNPPHIGHLLAAQYVRATGRFDEVWLLPSHRHRFGKELTDFEHRFQMCQLLCEDASGWLKVSRLERELDGDGATVDVLDHLRATQPQLAVTLIIGSDLLPDLPKWKEAERLPQLATVLVLHRAGYPSPRAMGPPLAEVSSSRIRELLAKGQPVDDLVPWKVLEYARAHRLYGP